MSLEDLDNELSAAGVPMRYRPLDCFKRLHGSVPDGPKRQKLFEPIVQWYLTKYGDSVRWDGIIARFPILIKGAVHLGLARFVGEGEILVEFEDHIEDLTQELAKSLSPEERRTVIDRLATGSRSFYKLHNLLIDDSWLAESVCGLIRRAVYDLENAAMTLKHIGDTQTAIVQAREAAEKFLKAALAKSGSNKKLKSFGHDIPKIFQELLQTDNRYSYLFLPIENLQKLAPNMELRYTTVARSVETAVEAYHGALYVCGMIAQMWIFDQARGSTKSDFKECSFYVDGADSTFYCKRIRGDTATLTLFRSSRITGSHMTDISLSAGQSALYFEVTDPMRDEELRNQLTAHIRNPGRRASPEEIGLKMVNGPEGSYVTAKIQVPIRAPKSKQR